MKGTAILPKETGTHKPLAVGSSPVAATFNFYFCRFC